MSELPDATFFTTADGTWFTPTEYARGPWDVNACHAGPPTALLARDCEASLPGHRLIRLHVDLPRPVPMAGFSITVTVDRAGRTTALATAVITDAEQRVCATARSLHVSRRTVLPATASTQVDTPSSSGTVVRPFPLRRAAHSLTGFRDAVAVRLLPGDETITAGATVPAWMRTIPLLPGEAMSPFQRVCPLADCTNAFSRQADDLVTFVNADLTVVLHREPAGEWIGSLTRSVWEPDGVGLATATLFDDDGPLGTASQVLVLA